MANEECAHCGVDGREARRQDLLLRELRQRARGVADRVNGYGDAHAAPDWLAFQRGPPERAPLSRFGHALLLVYVDVPASERLHT